MWCTSLDSALYFCRVEDYDDYVITPMHQSWPSRHRLLIVQKLDGSEMLCGTASELSKCLPNLLSPSKLHAVARGSQCQAYGYIARYADEETSEADLPQLPCVPNLSAFF